MCGIKGEGEGPGEGEREREREIYIYIEREREEKITVLFSPHCDCLLGRLTCLNQAEQKKKLGNAAFQAKNFTEAVAMYGQAIDIAGDEAPATYLSNRAVAWAAQGEWQHARDDAEKALQRPSGITSKTLFQKVRAELKLEDIDAAEQTMALANRCGLSEEVEDMLKARNMSLPEAAKAATGAAALQPEEAKHEERKSVIIRRYKISSLSVSPWLRGW